MSDHVDQRTRAAALLLTAASASTAFKALAAPALTALPVAGPGGTRNRLAAAAGSAAMEGTGAVKYPESAGD